MNTADARPRTVAQVLRGAAAAQDWGIVLEAAAELEGAPSDASPDDQQNGGDDGATNPTNQLPSGGSTVASATKTDNGLGVTSAGGESGLPLRLLDWVMEHTDAGYRVGTVHGVHWLDPRDGRGFLTRGKTYEDAITRAASECAAIDAMADAKASDAGSEVGK